MAEKFAPKKPANDLENNISLKKNYSNLKPCLTSDDSALYPPNKKNYNPKKEMNQILV